MRLLTAIMAIVLSACAGTRSDSVTLRDEGMCGLSVVTVSPRRLTVVREPTCGDPAQTDVEPLRPSDWSELLSALENTSFWSLPPTLEQIPDSQGRIKVVTDDVTRCVLARLGQTEKEVCATTSNLTFAPGGRQLSSVIQTIERFAPEAPPN